MLEGVDDVTILQNERDDEDASGGSEDEGAVGAGGAGGTGGAGASASRLRTGASALRVAGSSLAMNKRVSWKRGDGGAGDEGSLPTKAAGAGEE